MLHTFVSDYPTRSFAMNLVFPPHPVATLPIAGSDLRFPVRRVFCVGRNYADHAREMGALDQAEGREPPFFFTKPGDGVVGGEGEVGVAYPPLTNNLHHEVEMVVALSSGGANVGVEAASGLIFGYAVGLDLTRRDIQAKAKEKAHPWDMAKGFDQSAVAGAICPVATCGHPAAGRIWLTVNGDTRQDGNLVAMMWKVPEIIANLSTMVRLEAGDLIYTGTPAGVGPLIRGDVLEGGVAGVGALKARIV
jgi:fumarylpyruvate hydrolase